MSFVLYDVETSGLRKRFDQILQFAAVHANAELEVVDRFEIRSRLLPHIIPAPEALRITGIDIGALHDPGLPSHYEMIGRIRSRLANWCPALFLGFNSLRFDEEFLRHAFYQCLHNAYLTNTGGSARADVLGLCRITAAFRPDVLRPHREGNGRPIFRLADLARANGIAAPSPHDAMADVETMLALCRHIRAGAPELWSRFLQFTTKPVIDTFIREEEAFLLIEAIGDTQAIRLVTRIGQNDSIAIRQYCLDLHADHDALRSLTTEQLVEHLRGRREQRAVIMIPTNNAPMLCPLYDATPEQLGGLSEGDIADRVSALRADTPFLKRLRDAAQQAEPTYPPSEHVEEQLYGFPFPTAADQSLMAQFHASTWEQRAALHGQFTDLRYRQLARRLIFFERPDLLSAAGRAAIGDAISRRLLGQAPGDPPWLTIPAALKAIDDLLLAPTDDLSRERLQAYARHLEERQLALLGALAEQPA